MKEMEYNTSDERTDKESVIDEQERYEKQN